MAKTATLTAARSGGFIPGEAITEAELRALQELFNWVAVNRAQEVHMADDTVETYAVGAGWNEVNRGDMWLDEDVASYTVIGECTMPAAQTGQVRFTIGAVTATLTFTNATNGVPQTATISRSSAGTGRVGVIVEFNHTVGASNACTLNYRGIQGVAPSIATIPDPP